MTSYAQNFEDVVLRRALHDIDNGFYVDIGAFHPTIDSVTRWFYDQGWHGINVEPNPIFWDLLNSARPRDLNLKIAVMQWQSISSLTMIDGLSTVMPEIACQRAEDGFDTSRVVEVETITLSELLTVHAPGDRVIDFLKIDVEGAEAPIILPYAFDAVRPRIILAEATKPLSSERRDEKWHEHLIQSGYAFVYFDGLNNFYVREEDAWRQTLFSTPPNIFDNFFLAADDRRVELRGSPPAPSLSRDPDVDDLRQLVEVTTQQCAALQAELAAKSANAHEFLARAEGAEAALVEQSAEFADVKINVEGLLLRVERLSTRHEADQAANERLRVQANDLVAQLDERTVALVEAGKRSAMVRDRLASLESALSRSEAALAESRSRSDKLVGDATRLDAERILLSEDLNHRTTALAQLEGAYAESQAELAATSDRLVLTQAARIEGEKREEAQQTLLAQADRIAAGLIRDRNALQALIAVRDETLVMERRDWAALARELAYERARLERYRASLSWRLTAPLRYIGRKLGI